MNQILGSTGSSSPINPIRKKELDDKYICTIKSVPNEEYTYGTLETVSDIMEEKKNVTMPNKFSLLRVDIQQ